MQLFIVGLQNDQIFWFELPLYWVGFVLTTQAAHTGTKSRF